MKIRLLILSLLICLFFPISSSVIYARETFWEIQSVDTVKFSRDLAREKANDAAFVDVINSQVKRISSLGATHVAIGTPYDPEFVPFLKLWVKSARKEGLDVWFRGNFSGWEGWFNYPELSPQEHLEKTTKFITENPDIFKDGDIFTPCTECENGAIGDPRTTGEVGKFRNFLISEQQTSQQAFNSIGKKVKVGYFSMNGDVARLVMDKETTNKLGGVVVADHYVKNPKDLANDISKLAANSGGHVVLGEIGAPIPDIHGYMDDQEQNDWLTKTLSLLSQNPEVSGINYWVLEGGSSQIWPDTGKKPAADTLSDYFAPRDIKLILTDEIDKTISGVSVQINSKEWKTDNNGEIIVPLIPSVTEIEVTKDGYHDYTIKTTDIKDINKISLKRNKNGIIFSVKKFFFKLTSFFRGK